MATQPDPAPDRIDPQYPPEAPSRPDEPGPPTAPDEAPAPPPDIVEPGARRTLSLFARTRSPR